MKNLRHDDDDDVPLRSESYRPEIYDPYPDAPDGTRFTAGRPQMSVKSKPESHLDWHAGKTAPDKPTREKQPRIT